jgi:lycopene beta-cyclase
LARAYAVLDNASVLDAFSDGGVRCVTGVAIGADLVDRSMCVRLRDGGRVTARVVVDTTGQRRLLSGGPVRGPRAEQTAYGVVVPAKVAASLVGPGEAIFMDWGRTDGWPTFLYAVPVGNDRILLEETSLARRPGLPLDRLRSRLEARLGTVGIDARDDALGEERVRFAVDLPMPRSTPGAVAFGVAGAMMHPATGYSVGDALLTAPVVAEALAAALGSGPEAAAAAAHAAIWPMRARTVRRLRLAGLHMLLAMRPERVPAFFETFFDLPPALQSAYLSGRTDPAGTMAAMATIFASTSSQVRRAMLRAQVGSVLSC